MLGIEASNMVLTYYSIKKVGKILKYCEFRIRNCIQNSRKKENIRKRYGTYEASMIKNLFFTQSAKSDVK